MPREPIEPRFAERLIVGSWPGRSWGWNRFVPDFCDALEAAGCTVIDVDDPRRIARRLDILHIHWPEQIFWQGGNPLRLAGRTLLTLRALVDLRAAGVRVVWMVHNLRPHRLDPVRSALWRLIEAALERLVDGYMTLSPATATVVREALPGLADKPCAAPWHPAYPVAADLPTRPTARAATGLPQDATIFACIGLVRANKGVEDLAAAFAAHPDPAARLLIAGQCEDAELAARLTAQAAADTRIILRLARLDDGALTQLTCAASVIVLPFRDYLHSGSMIHALSHARPVLTPAAPFASGLAAAVGAAWVRTYAGPLDAATLAGGDWPVGHPDLSALSSAALGEAAVALYRQLATPVAKSVNIVDSPGART